MKTIMLALSTLILAACSGGGTSVRASTSPGTPVTVTPVVVPPSGPTWPLAGAVLTKTLGSVSCSTFATGIKCTDGAVVVTPGAMNFYTFTQLEISPTMICGLVEAAGTTADCTSLADPACTAPATANTAICMDFSYSVINLVSVGDHLGFTSPTFQTGTKSISAVGANMCLEQTAYLTNGAFDSNTTVCGPSLNSLGYIE